MSDKFRLDGKTAIVTGAGSGIGRAIALRFAESGAKVILMDLRAERAEEAANEIAKLGSSETQVIACDVTDREATRREFSKLATKGPIDILVNSAGVAHIGRLDNTSEEDFLKIFQVNVKGTYLCMQAVIEPMRRNGGGIILNMASIAATAGLSDRFAYSMSKGAVLAMTLSVAKDYLPDKIRCNSISPARVHTPFVDAFLRDNYPGRESEMFQKLSDAQPIGRMGTPDEVALRSVTSHAIT